MPGYEDYEVSNFGRVRRSAKTPYYCFGVLKSTKQRCQYGYPLVKLNRKKVHVHKIVMRAFFGDPPPGHEINHKDGNKENPHLDNLEYVTRQQNTQHAYDSGLISRSGELNGRSKLSEQHVKEIRKLLSQGAKYKVIQGKFNISNTCVWAIKQKVNWKHL